MRWPVYRREDVSLIYQNIGTQDHTTTETQKTSLTLRNIRKAPDKQEGKQSYCDLLHDTDEMI